MAVNLPGTVHLRWQQQRRLPVRSGAALIILVLLFPGAALAQTGTLTVDNALPAVGTPVTFTVNVTSAFGPPPPTTLAFGDSTPPAALSPPYPQRLTHVYARPGVYKATLSDDAGPLATTLITVVAGTLRVPHGIIYSTVLLASVVAAGNDTSIVVNYRVVTPALGSLVSNSPSLEAIIDLLDARGNLISRGDPVFIPSSVFAGGALMAAQIPFTVPSDARGTYRVRVYLRTPEIGGTVAVGDPVPLVVVGGPDPAPVVSSEVHASGSIEAGPRIGFTGTSGAIPNNASSGDFNANLKLALQQPWYTFSSSSALNATSRRLDPVLTLVPGSGNLDSPNSQQAAQGGASPAPLHYQHTFGPVTAALPSLLFSGGESLRGLDSVIHSAGWTYQSAFGFPHLATSTSGVQSGYLFDVGRQFSTNQNIHATFLQNIDDPNTFVSTVGSMPLNARAGGLEFDQGIGSHVMFKVGAAASGATQERPAGGNSTDSADKSELAYNVGSTSIDLEYHNFGANFATGNGVGAASDSTGGSALANFSLNPISSLALHFAREDKRSAVSRDGQENATFTLAPPSGMQVVFGAGNDHTLTNAADTTSRNFNLTLGRSASSSTFSFTGNLATVSDAMNASNDGVTRTGAFQYTLVHGASNISLGLNATGNQISTASSIFAESLVIAFPLGQQLAAGGVGGTETGGARSFTTSRGFEVQLSASNANAKAVSAATRDLNFGALLAYHLGPHVSLGFHGLTARHTDIVSPANNSTNTSLRVRMDVQI